MHLVVGWFRSWVIGVRILLPALVGVVVVAVQLLSYLLVVVVATVACWAVGPQWCAPRVVVGLSPPSAFQPPWFAMSLRSIGFVLGLVLLLRLHMLWRLTMSFIQAVALWSRLHCCQQLLVVRFSGLRPTCSQPCCSPDFVVPAGVSQLGRGWRPEPRPGPHHHCASLGLLLVVHTLFPPCGVWLVLTHPQSPGWGPPRGFRLVKCLVASRFSTAPEFGRRPQPHAKHFASGGYLVRIVY